MVFFGCVKGDMGIGIFGPALDANGNSIAGFKILELLSAQEGWSIFLIASYPAILAGFFISPKTSLLSVINTLTKNSAESFSISCIFVPPLLNNIVQPSAICGGVKDETNISNGKTTCS